MKRALLFIVLHLVLKHLSAQVPESFNYQAIPRNASGGIYADQTMKGQFSILSGSPSGAAVYIETFSATTSSLGILNLQIGKGTPVSGIFSTIDWGGNSYYLKVEIDVAGGTSYVNMGTTQLLSVPYSIYAKTSAIALNAVTLSGNQTVSGDKIFSGTISVPTPVNKNNAVTKEYVDSLGKRVTALENVIQKSDFDNDGFTMLDGDCDDNDSTVYPGAQEKCGDGIDQDCNGSDLICENFAINSPDPVEAAKAMGIYIGLLSANWVLPDGSPPGTSPNFSIGHGILSSFGPNVHPLEGNQFLAISTGTARTPADPGYLNDLEKGYSISFPAGFPKGSVSCPTPTSAYDGIALKLSLKVPDNVNTFSFSYKFYTKDYPNWVCSVYNDQVIVTVSPFPLNTYYGNVIFDSNGNPVSVNSNGTITCCSPSQGYICENGTSELAGTGFDNNGGSKWNMITVPVQPNESIIVTFAIWDSQDKTTTSTLLIDNWKWETNK